MRFLVFLGVLLNWGRVSWGQSPVRGRVLDGKDNSPLIGANVLLTRVPDSTKTGTAADAEGRFQFDNVAPGRYVLTASFVGYAPRRQAVNVPAGGTPIELGALALPAGGGVQLKNVVVTGQAVQTQQRGDTTAYNARAFKTNPDATAGDLVQKMPGVQRDATGKLQAQGENVQQVLVDGKVFFGTDPDAVLRNLPAESIDRVEVFDQQSEQSRFSGFNDGNTQKTLNIVTKPSFRNGRFGRVEGGAGTEGLTFGGTERYQASGNLNDFQGERRLTVLAQSNNTNVQNFGTADLLGVVGNSAPGGGGGGGGRGGGGGGPGGGFGQPTAGANPSDFLVNQSNGITTTNAAGLNYSNTWNKKTELTGSYFFNRAENVLNSSTFRQFVLPGQSNTTYAETARQTSLNTNHRANLRLDHKIDSLTSVLLRPSFSYQLNEPNQNLLSVTATGGAEQNRLATAYDARNRAVNPGGDGLIRRRLRSALPGRTVSLAFNGAYTDRTGRSDLRTDSSVPGSATALNQQAALAQTTWNAGGTLTYTEPLSRTAQLQASYSLGYAPNNSDRRTYNFDPSESAYSRLDTALSNVFSNYYLTHGGGLSLRYATRRLQAAAGATLQAALLRGDQTFPTPGPVRNSFVNVLPSAMLMYRPDREHNLRVFYRTATSPPSITQLQAVVNNSNPLQLSIGNPALRQQFQHFGVLRYSVAKADKKSNFFAAFIASVTQDPIATRTLVAARDTVVTPQGTAEQVRLPAGAQLAQNTNLQGQYNLRSVLNYGRPLLAKLNFNGNFTASYQQAPGLVNDQLNYARTPALGAGLTFSSNISERVDFTLSTQASQNWVRNTLSTRLNQTYYNQFTTGRLSLIFGPGLSLKSDVTYNLNRGLAQGFNQNFVLWNASVGKRLFPGQRGEIRLYAFDLLGQNRSIQRTVTNAYFQDVQTTVLQRYLLLMFSYNIRSANMTLPTAPEGEPGRPPGGFGPGGPPPPGGFPPGGPPR